MRRGRADSLPILPALPVFFQRAVKGRKQRCHHAPPTRLDCRCHWVTLLPLSSGPPYPWPCGGAHSDPTPRAHPGASSFGGQQQKGSRLAASPLVSRDPTKMLTYWPESSDPIADLSSSRSCQVGMAGRIRPDFPEVAPGSRKKDQLHSSPSSG